MDMFENSFEKGQFMSVYDETERDGKFHVCRYIYKDDDFVLFQAISTRGYNDGLYLIPIDYIYRVDIDDEYTYRIEKLFNLQDQQVFDGICLTDDSLLIDLFFHAKNNKLVSSAFLKDEEVVTGNIVNVERETGCISIQKLTDNGISDGISFINIELIEKVICDSGVERSIKMLSEI